MSFLLGLPVFRGYVKFPGRNGQETIEVGWVPFFSNVYVANKQGQPVDARFLLMEEIRLTTWNS